MEAARAQSTSPRRWKRLALVLAATLATPPLLFAAALFWPLQAPPLPDAGNSWVITNVRVLDVVNGQASEPTTVTVREGRITAIGDDAPDSSLPLLDAGGRWLSPGFWDMHTHALQLSPQVQFPLMLANGITGTRDMMDCPQLTDPLIACVADKRRWNAQAIAGQQVAPRFVQVASFYFEDPSMRADDALRRAREYDARGIDALKVYNRLRADTYQQLAAEAQRLQRPLIGHLPKAVSLQDALRADQRSFEHAHLFARHCFENAAQWRDGWRRPHGTDRAHGCRPSASALYRSLCTDAGQWCCIRTHPRHPRGRRARPRSSIHQRPTPGLSGSALALGLAR